MEYKQYWPIYVTKNFNSSTSSNNITWHFNWSSIRNWPTLIEHFRMLSWYMSYNFSDNSDFSLITKIINIWQCIMVPFSSIPGFHYTLINITADLKSWQGCHGEKVQNILKQKLPQLCFLVTKSFDCKHENTYHIYLNKSRANINCWDEINSTLK